MFAELYSKYSIPRTTEWPPQNFLIDVELTCKFSIVYCYYEMIKKSVLFLVYSDGHISTMWGIVGKYPPYS